MLFRFLAPNVFLFCNSNFFKNVKKKKKHLPSPTLFKILQVQNFFLMFQVQLLFKYCNSKYVFNFLNPNFFLSIASPKKMFTN